MKAFPSLSCAFQDGSGHQYSAEEEGRERGPCMEAFYGLGLEVAGITS